MSANYTPPDRFAGLRQSRELEDKFLLYVRILMASGLDRPAAKTRALDFLGLCKTLSRRSAPAQVRKTTT